MANVPTPPTTPVSLLNGSGIQSLGPGTYTATTDGFVFGVVNGAVSSDGVAFCWISGTCGSVSAVASGGQLAVPAQGSSSGTLGAMAVGTSFLLPVPANNPFTLTVNNYSGNAVDPLVSLVWIPMGTGQVSST